jgi:7-cyano-7-deazaguanine synthase in queuosine biosynthesis
MGPGARDLVRVGLAVRAIERALPGGTGGNRPVEFEVALHLEEPDSWTSRAVNALQELLAFQGDAAWTWRMLKRASPNAGIRDESAPESRTVDRVALFSGGLDSASGIASALVNAPATQLVSHYSRQKSLQLAIAGTLGYGAPTQIRTEGLQGRGRAFLYRSFYFLCLAAAVASTYRARRVIQYENGILATAIPPAPAYFMTRHAHPVVHRAAEQVFQSVLGGRWTIENPFLKFTKRECYDAMVAKIGVTKAAEIANLTETCWYQNSNQYLGGRKKQNGVACGVCIPCIVRRTATQVQAGQYDLRKRSVRADEVLSREFEAYQLFVRRALDPQKRARLLLEMPGYVRGLARTDPPTVSREELTDLVLRFSREFSNVFS